MVKNQDKEHSSIEIFFTQNKEDATRLAKKAESDGFTHIVAVGGDGTISDVAKALINSNAILGVIPIGSGNGFARSLCIPTDPKKALELFFKGKTKTIDTLSINGHSCLGVAGIGFDATVSQSFSEKTTRGLFTYISVILSKFPTYVAKNYELIIDGKPAVEKAFILCFANTNQYGNNAVIAPDAEIDDGFLDIAIIRDFPKPYSAKIAFDLVQCRLKNSPYFSTLKAKNVTIKSTHALLHIDGEPQEFTGDIHIAIEPQSLKIIAGEKTPKFKFSSGLKKFAHQQLTRNSRKLSSFLFP